MRDRQLAIAPADIHLGRSDAEHMLPLALCCIPCFSETVFSLAARCPSVDNQQPYKLA